VVKFLTEYLFDVVGSFLLAQVLVGGALLVSLKIWKRWVETSERREIQRSAISASLMPGGTPSEGATLPG
jgi:hypothetical protein